MTSRRHRRRARRLAREICRWWGADEVRRWALALFLERLPRRMIARAWKAWRAFPLRAAEGCGNGKSTRWPRPDAA